MKLSAHACAKYDKQTTPKNSKVWILEFVMAPLGTAGRTFFLFRFVLILTLVIIYILELFNIVKS